MTFREAKEQIDKGIDDYDDSIITRSALAEIVRVTLDDLAEVVADYLPDVVESEDEEWLDEDEYEIEFEEDEDESTH